MRAHLINSILEFAYDEFEDMDSLIRLAKKTDEQLMDTLIGILEYLKENH